MPGQIKFKQGFLQKFGQMARRIGKFDNRDLNISVLLALAFVAFNIHEYWNNWSVDFSAYYYAGYFFDQGQFDQIYAGPPQIIGPEMPESWTAALTRGGFADEQTYPYIYLPWIATVMAPVTRVISPMAAMNAATILNAILMVISIFLAWRIVAPQNLSLTKWTLISIALLATSSTSVLAMNLGQIQILVYALCLFAFERYRARAFWIAGGALALAACFKITPAVFILIFIWDRNWRALGGFFAVVAVIATFSLTVAGISLNMQYFALMKGLNQQVFIAMIGYSVEGFAYQVWDFINGTAPIHNANEYFYPKPQWIEFLAKGIFVVGIFMTWLGTRHLDDRNRTARQLLMLSILIPLTAPLGWVHYFLLTTYLMPSLFEYMNRKPATLLVGSYAVFLSILAMLLGITAQLHFFPTIILIVPFLMALFLSILAFGMWDRRSLGV